MFKKSISFWDVIINDAGKTSNIRGFIPKWYGLTTYNDTTHHYEFHPIPLNKIIQCGIKIKRFFKESLIETPHKLEDAYNKGYTDAAHQYEELLKAKEEEIIIDVKKLNSKTKKTKKKTK